MYVVAEFVVGDCVSTKYQLALSLLLKTTSDFGKFVEDGPLNT